MSAEEKLARARVIIKRDAAYMSSVLYGLVPFACEDVPTMCVTEHMVLMYNPTFVESLQDDVAAGIVMHECMHVLLMHMQRFGNILLGDEGTIANLAMDLSINPSLLEAGWKLTDDCALPEKFNLKPGLTAEQYFMELRKLQQKNKSPQGQPPKEGEAESKSKHRVCSGNCGGATGNKKGKAADREKEVDASIGRSDIDHQRIVKNTAEAIKREAQQGRGHVPMGLVELVRRLDEPPKIDWRSELAHVIRGATGKIRSGGMDVSMRRPSKRSFSRGLLRPGLIQHTPEICVVRDSSGSMGDDQIVAATNETVGIIQASGVDLFWFVDADAKVAFSKRIDVSEFRDLPVHGRGGTDFRPAVEHVTKLIPRPNVTIYITDGDGYAPKNPPPDMEFIWCVVPSYYKRKPADWGHLVVVSDKPIELKEPHEL